MLPHPVTNWTGLSFRYRDPLVETVDVLVGKWNRYTLNDTLPLLPEFIPQLLFRIEIVGIQAFKNPDRCSVGSFVTSVPRIDLFVILLGIFFFSRALLESVFQSMLTAWDGYFL